MNTILSRDALARSVFVAAMLGLSVLSLRSPTWAATLALQGYYADFVLTLTAPLQTVAAGSRFATDAQVLGRGPDTAERATVTFRGDDDLALVEAAGCVTLSAQTIRCSLPEIAPDARIDQRVWTDSNPDARGFRLISGFVASELLPTAADPGLGVDAIALEIRGEHASGVRVLNERPVVEPDLRLTWTFIIDNSGPSSLLSGRLVLSAEPDSLVTCRAIGNARCEGAAGEPLYLPIDGQLEIDVTVPPINPRLAATYLTLSLIREEGIDIGGRPDTASAAFEFAVFSDGFGD